MGASATTDPGLPHLALTVDELASRTRVPVRTIREYQTLCLIASGNSLTDIGRQMAISVKTVSVYRSRILEKMRMKNNAELTHYAIKNQIVVNKSLSQGLSEIRF